MKIAVAAEERYLQAPVAVHFGRASHFVIVDSDCAQTTGVANLACRLREGAGVRAARFLQEQDVDVVIAGCFGPHAQWVLAYGGIRPFEIAFDGSPPRVSNAVAQFRLLQRDDVGHL